MQQWPKLRSVCYGVFRLGGWFDRGDGRGQQWLAKQRWKSKLAN